MGSRRCASSTAQTGDVSSSWRGLGEVSSGSRSVFLHSGLDSEQDRKGLASLVRSCCYPERPFWTTINKIPQSF